MQVANAPSSTARRYNLINLTNSYNIYHMKKLFLAVMAVAASFAINVNAQTPATTGNDSVMVSSSELNALRSDVNTMKAELAELEAEKSKDAIWKRRRSWTFAYVDSKLSLPDLDDSGELKSKFGAAMQFSNTYFLHKPAILGLAKIGIDAVWLDVNYAKYEKEYSFDSEEEIERQQLEIGMGIGPSLTIAPFSWMSNGLRYLKVTGYYHVTPSASIMFLDGETNAAFNLFQSAGAKLTYRRLSIGIEKRWGTAKYDSIIPDDVIEATGGEVSDKIKFETNSLRAYISLNF